MGAHSRVAAAALTFAASACAAAGQVQCLDESGSPVDWWAMFKLPNGYQAAYWTSNAPNPNLRINADLSKPANPLFQTLSSIDQNLGFLLYNDESPESLASAENATLRGANWVKYGHTKGALSFNGNAGFWLVHSTPRFPTAGDWTFPDDETIYGQSFLCISMGAAGVAAAGELFTLNKPSVYSSNLPSDLAGRYPSLGQVLSKNWVTDPVGNSSIIDSIGGTSFVAFGKTGEWNQELYADLVAPFFKSGMLTETWIRSPALPSYCPSASGQPPYEVREVRELTIGGTQFKYTQDHSKWGIVEQGNEPFVCIGDINRMSSQAERGGGTVCFRNEGLWSALSSAITTADRC